MENSPLICRTNQWTGLYMIKNFVIKELKVLSSFVSGSLEYASGLRNSFLRIVIWIEKILNFFFVLKKGVDRNRKICDIFSIILSFNDKDIYVTSIENANKQKDVD